MRQVGKVVQRGAGVAAKVAEKTLSAIADAFTNFFPSTPLTPAQIEEENKRHEAAANDQESAFAKYARDTEHERTKARQQDEARQKQIEREQYERLERGRGGRER